VKLFIYVFYPINFEIVCLGAPGLPGKDGLPGAPSNVAGMLLQLLDL
jgi:hypothetical protein